MKNDNKSAMFVCAVLMQAGAASAAGAAPTAVMPDVAGAAAAGVDPLRAMLESKLRLVKLVLAQSPAAQRIPHSSNAQAIKKLADAQALYAKADAESKAGRTQAATQFLDEALRQIVLASYLVPDAAKEAARERGQNIQLREAIRTFQPLYKNISSYMPSRKGQSAEGAAELSRIDGMLDNAEALMASDKQHEANVLLNDAYKIVVSTLNKMLAAETIVYSLKFDSAAEEFRHELARNRGYEELIPIALAQSNKGHATAILAERYVKQSRDLRDTAQKQANGGDYKAAVKALQDATGHLQRSLRIAGVVVPQTIEN